MSALLAAGALGLAGCGGGGGTPSSIGTSVTTTPATSVPGGTSTTGGPTPTTRARARFPGPPGPIVPGDVNAAVRRWYALLQSGIPGGRCQPLLDDVARTRLTPSVAGPAYVVLYRGAAEGCLGRTAAARADLGQARVLLARLDAATDDGSIDTTCQPQQLLIFAFDAFLGEQVSVNCPRSTSSTRGSTRPATSTTGRSGSTTTIR